MLRKWIHRSVLTLIGVFLIGFLLLMTTIVQLTLTRSLDGNRLVIKPFTSVRPRFLLQMTTIVQLTLTRNLDEGRLAIKPFTFGRTPTNDTRESDSSKSKSSHVTTRKKYHVLINSYMNSGSRFTGQLFGFRHDAFYFYEPLWRFSVWDYFHEPDQVCSSLKKAGNCQTRTAAQVNYVYQRGTAGSKINLVPNITAAMTVTELMEDVLYRIYHCEFANKQNLVVQGVHDHSDLAGPGWSEYRLCTRRKTNRKLDCLKQQEQLCRQSGHVVTKVLRLTTMSLERLMTKIPNLKVIQLFRDPRAIVNSRLESSGYPGKDVAANAAALCHKMYLDYAGGLELKKKFPGRFRFVFYDDIKENVQEKIEKLYEFVGMEYDKKEVANLNKVKTNTGYIRTKTTLQTRAKDNANWWRAHLSHVRYQAVMNQCTGLVPVFNMTKYHDITALKDFSVPAMNLPVDFRIKIDS